MVRLPPALRPLFPYLKPAYTAATRAAAPVTIALSARRGAHLPRGSVATLRETGGTVHRARAAEVIARTPPDGLPARHPVFSADARELMPEVLVAELPGGRVLGPQRAVITADGCLVQDLSFYFGTSRAREHPLYLHPFPPPPLEVSGRLGVLASRGDANYYHFLVDVLPRLGVLAQTPQVEAPERWYVPASARFQRELLELAGVGTARRIDADAVGHVRAETLVVPGLAAVIVQNPPWIVAFLRGLLMPAAPAQVPGRRIYITRDVGPHNRQVVNEAALIARLSARGFVVLDLAALPVTEQIAAFAQAEVIVAAHGAALANLVFAGPGALVVELFPAGSVVSDYWKLAHGVPGLTYRYLARPGPSRTQGRARFVVSDIDVDLDALDRVIDHGA